MTMYFLTNYAGLWPDFGLLTMFIAPPLLVLCLWAGLWIVRRTNFAGWRPAAFSAGTAILLIIGGLLIFFLWPVTVNSDPRSPPLPGYDVLFKLLGGFELTLGGLAALLGTLTLWGIHELVRAARNRPRSTASHRHHPPTGGNATQAFIETRC